MDANERIRAVFAGETPDQIPVFEHFWSETIALWREQGHLGQDESPADHFGYEMGGLPWPTINFGFEPEVVRETDDYIVTKDANGVTAQRHKTESGHTPHWIDWTLKDRETWERYKPQLIENSTFLKDDLLEVYAAQRAKGRFVTFSHVECYESAWPVFGQVQLFQLMMDDIDLVYDVMSTYTDLIINAAQAYLDAGVDFDGGWFYGDVGYRSGLLFSPQVYEKVIHPNHKRMIGWFNERDKPCILHSCGKIKSLIPKFIEEGFSGLNPIEAKCDQDIRDLTDIYGSKLVWTGNFDIRKLGGTRADVEEEVLGKLDYLKKKGARLIFHSDHSIPQTISYENYAYALQLVREYEPWEVN